MAVALRMGRLHSLDEVSELSPQMGVVLPMHGSILLMETVEGGLILLAVAVDLLVGEVVDVDLLAMEDVVLAGVVRNALVLNDLIVVVVDGAGRRLGEPEFDLSVGSPGLLDEVDQGSLPDLAVVLGVEMVVGEGQPVELEVEELVIEVLEVVASEIEPWMLLSEVDTVSVVLVSWDSWDPDSLVALEVGSLEGGVSAVPEVVSPPGVGGLDEIDEEVGLGEEEVLVDLGEVEVPQVRIPSWSGQLSVDLPLDAEEGSSRAASGLSPVAVFAPVEVSPPDSLSGSGSEVDPSAGSVAVPVAVSLSLGASGPSGEGSVDLSLDGVESGGLAWSSSFPGALSAVSEPFNPDSLDDSGSAVVPSADSVGSPELVESGSVALFLATSGSGGLLSGLAFEVVGLGFALRVVQPVDFSTESQRVALGLLGDSEAVPVEGLEGFLVFRGASWSSTATFTSTATSTVFTF